MSVRYAFLAGEEGNYPVRKMVAWAKVSRSGYYEWKTIDGQKHPYFIRTEDGEEIEIPPGWAPVPTASRPAAPAEVPGGSWSDAGSEADTDDPVIGGPGWLTDWRARWASWSMPRVATARPSANALRMRESWGSDWNSPFEAMR